MHPCQHLIGVAHLLGLCSCPLSHPSQCSRSLLFISLAGLAVYPRRRTPWRQTFSTRRALARPSTQLSSSSLSTCCTRRILPDYHRSHPSHLAGPSTPSRPSLATSAKMLSIRAASLTLLCIWMTLLTVVMHVSRTERPPGVPPYKPASAVILAELGKLICSLLLAYREVKQTLKQERASWASLSSPFSMFKSSPAGIVFDADSKSDTPDIEATPRRASRLLNSGLGIVDSSNRSTPSASRRNSIEEKDRNLMGTPTSTSMSRNSSSNHSSQQSPLRALSLSPSARTSNESQYLSPAGTIRDQTPTNPKLEEEAAEFENEALMGSSRTASEEHSTNVTGAEVLQRMKEDTFGPDWLKLSIPAFLFTGQSNLSYYASTNLSMPVFQITYQLKIPATALCSVLMLNRALSRMQWFSIVLLSVGVGIVQLASSTADKEYHPHSTGNTGTSSERITGPGINNGTSDPLLGSRAVLAARSLEDGAHHVEMNQMLGLIAVVLACLSSGFSGVFFEKQLKRPSVPSSPSSPDPNAPASATASSALPSPPRKTGLWIRNIQLSMFSLFVGFSIYAALSPSDIPNFLIGFTPIVWFVVFVQVVGGLLAAVVIQYADNIAKSFSASCSIILSFAVSIAFFDFRLSAGVVVGSAAVMFATWLFNYSAPPPSAGSNQSFLPTSGKQSDYANLPTSPKSADYVHLRQQQSPPSANGGNSPAASRRPSMYP